MTTHAQRILQAFIRDKDTIAPYVKSAKDAVMGHVTPYVREIVSTGSGPYSSHAHTTLGDTGRTLGHLATSSVTGVLAHSPTDVGVGFVGKLTGITRPRLAEGKGTRSHYIRSLLDEDQILPYSTPGFEIPHPVRDQLTQSAATKYANKLRSIQRERFFRKAISASWKTPKATTPTLTPSQAQDR